MWPLIIKEYYNFLFRTPGKGTCYLALIGLCLYLYRLYIVVILIEIVNSVGIHFMFDIAFWLLVVIMVTTKIGVFWYMVM